jgi:hypothetical protein
MTFTVSIEMGNAAMQTGHDIAKALSEVAAKVVRNYPGRVESDYGNAVMDENGNKVGEWGFDDDGGEWDQEDEEESE